MTSREYKFTHMPVMLDECIDMLGIVPEGIYVDCTVGGAGHSAAILKRLDARGQLICIDKDQAAIDASKQALYELGTGARVVFIHGDFSDLTSLLRNHQVDKVNGILVDFGVSSYQLDSNFRGFGYMQDGPLDMRMDTQSEVTAQTVVNTYPEARLIKILEEYGEERYSRRIAAAICRQRSTQPIKTTGELTDIITRSIPPKARREKQHPAKRTFQAIRIEVNDELKSIERLLAQIPELLLPGGRFAAISFHSLEDRLVKEAIRSFVNPCVCPKNFPVCSCGRHSLGKSIGQKPMTATESEIETNPRARSAKLRVFEKMTINTEMQHV